MTHWHKQPAFSSSSLSCSLPPCIFHCLVSFKSVNSKNAGKHTVKYSLQCFLCDNLEAHFSKQCPRVWVFHTVYYHCSAKRHVSPKNNKKIKQQKKISIYFKGLRLNQNIYFCACYGLVYLHDSQLQSAHSLSLMLGEA